MRATWDLIGWDGLSFLQQRVVVWFQGAAVGFCGGFWLKQVGGALVGGWHLPRRKPKRKRGKGRR